MEVCASTCPWTATTFLIGCVRSAASLLLAALLEQGENPRPAFNGPSPALAVGFPPPGMRLLHFRRLLLPHLEREPFRGTDAP